MTNRQRDRQTGGQAGRQADMQAVPAEVLIQRELVKCYIEKRIL